MSNFESIDDLLFYLAKEQSQGRLREDTMDKYAQLIQSTLQDQKEAHDFVRGSRAVFENVTKLSDVNSEMQELEEEEQIIADLAKAKLNIKQSTI